MTGTHTDDHSSVRSVSTDSSSLRSVVLTSTKTVKAAVIVLLPLKKVKTSELSSSIPVKPSNGNPDIDIIETPTTRLDVEADLSGFINSIM